MRLSVIIPSYNESFNIMKEIFEVENVIKSERRISTYEIIVVDDHSSDDTFQKVLNQSNSHISCIRLSKRSGSHTALRAGIQASRGDLVLCIAADGQDDPHILSQMLDQMERGSQIVWGVRKKREESFVQKSLAFVFYLIINKVAKHINSSVDIANADFFLIDKKVINALNQCHESKTSLMGLLIWMGFNHGQVAYDRDKRRNGQSKWNFNGRFMLAKDWIIAFSGIPLTYASYFGMATAMAGMLYALFIIAYALMGHSSPGWAETVVLILVLGGIQMAMLGLLGEYLWRGVEEIRKRPLYFVEKYSFEEKAKLIKPHPLNKKAI